MGLTVIFGIFPEGTNIVGDIHRRNGISNLDGFLLSKCLAGQLSGVSAGIHRVILQRISVAVIDGQGVFPILSQRPLGSRAMGLSIVSTVFCRQHHYTISMQAVLTDSADPIASVELQFIFIVTAVCDEYNFVMIFNNRISGQNIVISVLQNIPGRQANGFIKKFFRLHSIYAEIRRIIILAQIQTEFL